MQPFSVYPQLPPKALLQLRGSGVDNIREIVDEVSYSPAEGKYKVYIIDEVHMLSIGAFNALLKTLEEPPSYVIFILATTEAHKIPITIMSRCQRYDFKRITIDTIADRLSELMETEGVHVEDKALRYIAKAADGSMRDALSLLDQCIAFHFGEELTYDKALEVLGAVDTSVFSRLFELTLEKDVTGCIELLEEIVVQGRELSQFVTDFTWYLRNLLLAQSSENIEEVIDVSTENMKRLKAEAEMADMDTTIRYIRIFSELSGRTPQWMANSLLHVSHPPELLLASPYPAVPALPVFALRKVSRPCPVVRQQPCHFPVCFPNPAPVPVKNPYPFPYSAGIVLSRLPQSVSFSGKHT